MASRRQMGGSECWRAVGCIEARQSIRLSCFNSFLRRSSLLNFTIMETIPNQPNSCLKTSSRSSRVTTLAEDRYIAVVAKWNRRSTSTRLTFMISVDIGKTISTTTVRQKLHVNRQKLHVNGQYAWVPWVCVPLSVQSRGTRSKWWRQYVNWTVPDLRMLCSQMNPDLP